MQNKAFRAQVVFCVLAVLMLMAAIFRIIISPESWWKVAVIIFISALPIHQTYQFLSGGMMISRLGRSLENDSDHKIERAFYFLMHMIIVFTCIYFLVAGKTALGAKYF